VLAVITPAFAPLLDQRTHAEAEARLGAALSALGQARAQTARAGVAKGLADQELERIRKLGAAAARQQGERAEFEARRRGEERASAGFAEKVAAEEVRLARATIGQGARTTGDRHVDVLVGLGLGAIWMASDLYPQLDSVGRSAAAWIGSGWTSTDPSGTFVLERW
jgi:HlyD family secretion protein